MAFIGRQGNVHAVKRQIVLSHDAPLLSEFLTHGVRSLPAELGVFVTRSWEDLRDRLAACAADGVDSVAFVERRGTGPRATAITAVISSVETMISGDMQYSSGIAAISVAQFLGRTGTLPAADARFPTGGSWTIDTTKFMVRIDGETPQTSETILGYMLPLTITLDWSGRTFTLTWQVEVALGTPISRNRALECIPSAKNHMFEWCHEAHDLLYDTHIGRDPSLAALADRSTWLTWLSATRQNFNWLVA